MQVNSTSTQMFRVKAVAEVLDVHISTVYRLIESSTSVPCGSDSARARSAFRRRR